MSQVAGETPPPEPSRRRRTPVRDVVEVVAIAMVLYFGISFAFQVIRGDGNSMVPTMQTQDLLLATKFTYHLHDPERGDIIILKPPDAADAGKDFIKRVIGIPGDTIKFDGYYVATRGGAAEAAILIKPAGQSAWQRLSEGYLPNPWTTGAFCCQEGQNIGMYSPDNRPHEVLIPAGKYLVLGDNRNQSKDSRYIGLIPRENIISKAWIRLGPFRSFGSLGDGPRLVPTGTAQATSAIAPDQVAAPIAAAAPAVVPLLWRRRRRIAA